MSSRQLNRRAVLAGTAALVPAAAMGAALGAPALAQLIAAHRAAYEAFSKAVDIYDNNETTEPGQAWNDAADAERDALFELCSYHCKSIEEASAKAAYLLTTADVRDDALQPEHAKALLESFLAA